MIRHLLLALLLAPLLVHTTARAQSSPDYAAHFRGYTTACFVLLDMTTGTIIRYNPERAAERVPPCSTFKIFNSMAGLQTGAVRDEHTMFAWDGRPMSRKETEHDFTLDSAFKLSVVWYYQKVATLVGVERMQHWLDSVGYGNRDMSAGLTQFWLSDSSLKISADEQVEFLRRLYRNELPFDRRAMEITRKIMVMMTSDGAVLSGKTGSGEWGNRTLGWFVGHLTGADGHEYVFAANMEAPSGAWGPKARETVIDILTELHLFRRP